MALDAIARHKRRQLSSLVAPRNVEPSTRSFADALRRPGISLVMECKKASPSRGLLRPDFDATELAQIYARYADAISVLADEKFFGGSPATVREVRQAVDLPILYKDVVVHRDQLYLARAVGADAILLMFSVLTDQEMARCLTLAERLGLDVVGEVHDEAELTRALATDIEIIGINNRDLHSLDIDLRTTARLAARVPDDRLILGESGYSGRRDIVTHRACTDGFLIGSSLVSATDVDRAARELRYGRVKICGLTSEDAVTAAYGSGATHAGFLLSRQIDSPRGLSIDEARPLSDAATSLTTVGVFVDDEQSYVQRCVDELGLDVVQYHGRGPRRAAPNHVGEVWDVQRIGGATGSRPDPGTGNRGERVTRRAVLDTYDPRRHGGTGRPFDWSTLDGDDHSTSVLAGGISPDNVAEASALGFYALDLSSGVETTPGVKCPLRLRQLFDNIASLAAREGDHHDS